MQEKYLEKLFQQDLTSYSAIPFWSWNNELDEQVLTSQILDMKEAGMGGFIMHARLGLTTQYLGEKWFSCIGACLKKARELGMKAWIYDENGWPSGFVGGALLENESYRAKYLKYEVKDSFDDSAFCVFVEKNHKYLRVKSATNNAKVYHCIYLCVSPSNTDILNPAVVDAFIAHTHEKYYERFADSFGRELEGFFTDEPQYYRTETPYTEQIENLFSTRYGEDVKDGLVYLFVSSESGYAFRTKFFTAMNELYTDNYYKKVYDWCNAHHCKLTGHSVEETSLAGQMLGGAGVMSTYEYEHIPAIDFLGGACALEVSPKQVGSVSAQLGKKQVLTETFGCAGYDITPRELCSIGEYQYFNGVTLMCHHLFPYSLAGQGKYDYPPVFSKQNNWWQQFRVFNDHFTKLGYLISNTKEEYDVGILHPLRSVYLEYIWGQDSAKIQALQKDLDNLLIELRKNGVRFQFIDETILKRHGKIEADKLVVGNCAYNKIIVPAMLSMARSSLCLLQAYKGRILLLSEIAYIDGVKEDCYLRSNITMDEIIKERGVRYRCDDGNCFMTSRKGEFGEFVFIKNLSREQRSTVYLENGASTYQAFHLESCVLESITDEFTLKEHGSIILFKHESQGKPICVCEDENITKDFVVTHITPNYFVIDSASYSKDGLHYSSLENMQKIFDGLLEENYKGKLYIKHFFTLNDKMPLCLMCESNRYEFIKVNGKDICLKQSDFDINFRESDITKCIKIGQNEIVYAIDYFQDDRVAFALFDPRATESVKNCLYYDTHLENVYLKGEFIVDSDMTIQSPKEQIALTSKLYENGYPFFYGVVELTGAYEYNGQGKRVLSLEQGRFLVAEIIVNGIQMDMIFDTEMDITRILKKGRNSIVIRLRSSLRNLFGPHHSLAGKDFEGLTNQFTFRGQWKKTTPLEFSPNYHFARFGVDKISIKKEITK